MKNYIGAKIIKAEPMDELTFLERYEGKEPIKNKQGRPGYHVESPVCFDDYSCHGWLSKNVFENTYRLITGSEMCLIIADFSG